MKTEVGRRRGLMLFCPHQTAHDICDISLDELNRRSITAIILDLDNTLVRWQQEDISEEVLNWIAQAKSLGIALCILSNSFSGHRVKRMAQRLEIPFVRRAKKPGKAGFHQAFKLLDCSADQTAIIGDQMFTDILGGNRAGVYTILVNPIHSREFLYTRIISRPPERLLIRHFRRRGHMGA